MKKILAVIFIIPILLFCGFKRKSKPIILLSANPITQESVQVIENNFNARTRIFYALYAPDGFKKPGVRLQISKQDDKTSNWGFTVVMSRDIYLTEGENIYKDYIFLNQAGHYIIQFFYLDNKDYPFAHREFRVH